MKLTFIPTNYRNSKVRVDQPEYVCRGLDNEEPATVTTTGTSGGYFYVYDFYATDESIPYARRAIENFFYNSQLQYYIKSARLRVKVAVPTDSPLGETGWTSDFYNANSSTITYPVSGLEVQEPLDMETPFTTIDRAFYYNLSYDQLSIHGVYFNMPTEASKQLLVYGVELEIEYENCFPITFSNLSTFAIYYHTYSPGATDYRTSGNTAPYKLSEEVTSCPPGGTVKLSFKASSSTPKPYVHKNRTDVTNDVTTISNNQTQYDYEFVANETTDIRLSKSELVRCLVSETYVKKNGAWAMDVSLAIPDNGEYTKK